MKKKSIIVTIVVLILMIIVIILSDKFYGMKISIDYKTTKNCIKKENCSIPKIDRTILKVHTRSAKLKNTVSKLNKKTISLYEESLNSKVEGTECTAALKKYKHRKAYQNIFNVYENRDIVVIAVERIGLDVCTNASTDTVETYYYDLKQNKFISQKELLKRYPIKKIEETIGNNILRVNKEESTAYRYIDTMKNGEASYKVYFDYEGQAYAYYKQYSYNKYYSAELNYKIKD